MTENFRKFIKSMGLLELVIGASLIIAMIILAVTHHTSGIFLLIVITLAWLVACYCDTTHVITLSISDKKDLNESIPNVDSPYYPLTIRLQQSMFWSCTCGQDSEKEHTRHELGCRFRILSEALIAIKSMDLQLTCLRKENHAYANKEGQTFEKTHSFPT